MKAFKKWWDTTLCSNNEQYKMIAEMAYRKALEEVLTQVDTSNSEGSGLKHRIIIDWIKKELEE